MITVEDAQVEHVWQVEEDIRMEDLMEWYGATGLSFRKSIRQAFSDDQPRKVALLDGTPVCFWGWNHDGVVWLFGTNHGTKNFLHLHRILHKELAVIHQEHPKIIALADCRNTLHHTWLNWLGFIEQDVVALHPFGLPYKAFTRSSPCVPQP